MFKKLLQLWRAYRHRREWPVSRQLELLHTLIREDNRWLAHDKTAAALTKRYLDVLSPEWMNIIHDSSVDFRSAIGPTPQRLVDSANKPEHLIQEDTMNTAAKPKFSIGDTVRKKSGSVWSGTVCGTYSTSLTPEGYAVESGAHPGSVQIYPAGALEAKSKLEDPAPIDAARLRAALEELVAVKDLEHRTEVLHFVGPLGTAGEAWEAQYQSGRKEYLRREPAAWDEARAAIKKQP